MSYTIHHGDGTVTRNSDGKVVAPCQSVDDPDFVSYHAWIDAGNEPSIDDAQPVIVPQSITPRQIRLALNQLGLRAQVEAAIAAGSQNLKDEWQFTSAFERSNPEIIALGEALGADLDQLFILAATL